MLYVYWFLYHPSYNHWSNDYRWDPISPLTRRQGSKTYSLNHNSFTNCRHYKTSRLWSTSFYHLYNRSKTRTGVNQEGRYIETALERSKSKVETHTGNDLLYGGTDIHNIHWPHDYQRHHRAAVFLHLKWGWRYMVDVHISVLSFTCHNSHKHWLFWGRPSSLSLILFRTGRSKWRK